MIMQSFLIIIRASWDNFMKKIYHYFRKINYGIDCSEFKSKSDI